MCNCCLSNRIEGTELRTEATESCGPPQRYAPKHLSALNNMFGLFTDKAGVCIIKFKCRALPILGSAVLQELSMGQKLLDERQIKESVKQALVDLLRERKDLLYELIAEVVEEYGLARAIKEGEQTPKVSREKVLRTRA